jgi:16S rRNA (uracil1498-N3)-methyltransferase
VGLFFDETWFYAPVDDGASTAILPPDEAHHAARVLRLKPGADIVVTNGAGSVFRATLRDEKGGIAIAGRIRHDPLPPGLGLGLPLLKGRDTEQPAEAACEFDLRDVFLLKTDHSAEFRGQDFAKMVERLRVKSVTALKQAKKSWLTRIHPPQTLHEWRTLYASIPLVVAHPWATTIPVPLPPELHLLTGPEGGFSDGEISYLFKEVKAYTLRLGETRLRAIHAPTALLGSLVSR